MTAKRTQAEVSAIETRITPTSPADAPAYARRRQRRGPLRFVIWIVLLLLFGFAFYLVLNQKPVVKTRMIPPVAITTGTAQKGNIGVYIDAIGTVTPVYTASIYSQVAGPVLSVDYREGQLVTKGSLLVDIDSRPFEATLLQAQGTLERDENVLGQAQMDLERYQEAWSRNAIAKQTLDDQEKLVKQDQGAVKNDEGAVEYDELQVQYCHITAPFSGQVGLRLVDPGNLVAAGAGGSTTNPLVVLTQLQPITVIFTIAEDSLGQVEAQIRKNAVLTVEAYDRSGQTKLATGKLEALDNQIDTTTGTLKLRALFDNQDFSLFPNQFVNIRLLVQTLEGVTLVPTACIQQNGQVSFVYVIQDGVVHQRDVQPGVSDNGLTQVDGVNPGEIVADSSFDKLQDNGKAMIAGAPGGGGAGGGWGGHSGGGGGGWGGHSAGGGSPGGWSHSGEGGGDSQGGPEGSAEPGHSPHHHHSPQPDQQ